MSLFGVSVFTSSHVLVWNFQCLQLGNKFKRGKLLAYQLICQMMLRPHQVPPSRALLARFYNVLHAGLISNDQVGMEVFERTLLHAGVIFTDQIGENAGLGRVTDAVHNL